MFRQPRIDLQGVLFAVGLVATAALANPARAGQVDCAGFRDLVFKAVGQQRALAKGSYAVRVLDHEGGVVCEAAVQGNQVIYPASSVKTLIAVAALNQVDQGRLSLDRLVEIRQPNAAVECRDWGCAEYGPGKKLSLRKLLADMIQKSNNLATNQLIDVVTRPELADAVKRLGLDPMRVARKMYNIQDPEPGNTVRNQATADSLVRMYDEIATGRERFLSEGSRELLIEWLGSTVHNDRLNARFPEGVKFFHKTGSTSRVSADAGFYRADGGLTVILAGLQAFVDFAALASLGRSTYDWIDRQLR